jgi:hypothetical protein
MAYADTAKRTILEAWGKFEVTAGAAFEKGDLVGYNSGWVLADGNPAVPAVAVALRDAALGEVHVPLARGAIVEGPTGATAGGAVYLSDTAGDTSQTPGTTVQVVGKAISATRVLLDPGKVQIKTTASINFAAAGVAGIFFVAPYPCTVTKISAVYATAAGQAGALTVERLQGTEAPAAGDDLLATTKIDLYTTINTVQSPDLTGTGAHLTLAAGDRLALKLASGNAATLANACVTVELEPA